MIDNLGIQGFKNFYSNYFIFRNSDFDPTELVEGRIPNSNDSTFRFPNSNFFWKNLLWRYY